MARLTRLLLFVWLAGGAGAADGTAHAPSRQPDPRLSRKLDLPSGKPVPMALVFSMIANQGKIGLVAAAPELRQPITLTAKEPTVAEVLRELEAVLEGKWRRDGDLYVLGPPEGLEEIAALHPLRARDYVGRQWRLLGGKLRGEEWKRLRTRQPVEFSDLRPELQAPALQIARYLYWHDRQLGTAGVVRLAMIEKRQLRLYLAEDRERPGRAVLSIGVYPRPGAEALRFERHPLP